MGTTWKVCLGLTLIFLCGLTGCGSPDDSILQPGSQTVVAKGEGSILHGNDGGGIFPLIKAGVMLRVGHDPGDYIETDRDFEDRLKQEKPEEAAQDRKSGPWHFKNGNPNSNLRDVSVTVESGEFRGVSGKISRRDIRPVK